MASTTRMDSSPPSTMCANKCGFFGSARTLNFCSKCYEGYLKTVQESAPPPIKVKREKFSSASLVTRCRCCNKKLGLTGFKCRCGKTFCGSHRYPDEHCCSFDFKEADLQFLVKQNPLIKADKRLEDVRQLGYDQIVLFQFGVGANAHYIILELYAQGNIILTDSDFTVLTLLHSHGDDDKGIAIMSRHRYPVEICRVFERTTLSKLQDAVAASLKEQENVEPVKEDESQNKALKEKKGGKKGGKSSEPTKDSTRSKQATLKQILGEALGYGPALAEHIILEAGLVPNTKVSAEKKLESNNIEVLGQAVARFEDWLQDVIAGGLVPKGFILMQKMNLGKDSSQSESNTSGQMYDEVCPILLNQLKSREHVNFETFDMALDEFYSKIESQRVDHQQKAKEGAAVQKLNKIKMDQVRNLNQLHKQTIASRSYGDKLCLQIQQFDSIHLHYCCCLLRSDGVYKIPDKAALPKKVDSNLTPSSSLNAMTCRGEQKKWKYKGIIDCVQIVVREKGLAALLKGIQPRVLWIGIDGSIFFGVLERTKRVLAQKRQGSDAKKD
ncbi:hypothetical protein ACFE04_027748 [Oxalis oulophora]